MFEISINQLSGTIPVALAHPFRGFGGLMFFYAQDNKLVGSLPDGLLTSCLQMVIHDNQLTGSLPTLQTIDALILVCVCVFRSRPGTPNQRKGQNEKFMRISPIFVNSGVFP